MRRGILKAVLSLLLVLVSIAYPLFTLTVKAQGEDKFPWLSELEKLTTERDVTLVVITRHEQSIQTLSANLFLQSPVAQRLGIKNIQWLYVAAEQWPDYIQKAKERGRPIDVAWGGGPTLFNHLYSLGILSPIDNSTNPEHSAILYELTKLPEKIAGSSTYLRGEDGKIYWIGASISSFGFTINKKTLTTYGLPEPASWDDLTNPIYAKYLPTLPMIGLADPEKSTSNTRIFEIILQAKGWENGWRTLTLMAANAKVYSGSGDVRDAVITGDIAIGTTIDFYGYMAQKQNPSCKYIAPSGETIVNSDPIALVKGSSHPVHAAAFIAWVLSEWGGQQVWLDPDISRLPINPLIFNTPAGAVRQDLKDAIEYIRSMKAIDFNETLSSAWVWSVIYYFKATLINAHNDLQSAWASIAQAYLDGKITKEQFDTLVAKLTEPIEFRDPVTGNTVKFTLEYALTINDKLSDSSIRQSLMTQWEQKARERYMSAYNLLQDMMKGEEGRQVNWPLIIGSIVLVIVVLLAYIYVSRSRGRK